MRSSARACVERGARRQATEQLGHAVHAPRDHGGRKMMRTGHHIDQDLGLRRILHRRLQHADDGGRARIKPYGPADHGRIALQRVLPETIGQHAGAGSVGTIVVLIEQPAQHRAQSHHLEIGSVDYSGAHLARLAQPYHGEADGGELAKRANRLHARFQVLDLGHGKGRVFVAVSRRALPNVDKPVLTAVDQRPQQNAAHQAEDGGIGANSQRQASRSP